MSEPVHVAVLIIGSGFGGIAAARAVRRLGVDDLVILERDTRPGGTWHQNTYPGAAVDVQSPLYSLSGEPWDWSRMFAEQPELAAYTDHLLASLDLHRHLVLGAEVVEATWDPAGWWRVRVRDGRVWRARAVIDGSGPLSEPNIPPFEGRDTFEGPSWHTGRWNHDVDLTGRRVAVIGSGASAAQVIPAIAERVGHLHVFQRTAHWVLPRPDRTFTRWQRALLRWHPAYTALRWAIYWGLETRLLGFKYSRRALRWRATRPALAHLRRQVPDPALRAKLTPDYTIGCKRIILSNTLYPALSRPNVTLHDRSSGIARIVPDGVETTDGQHVAVDAIVYATGFAVGGSESRFPVTGRDGVTLTDRMTPFPRAYLGTSVPSIPNWFVLTGPNTGIGHTSAIFVMESQLQYIAAAIRRLRDGVRALEPTPAAEAAWTRWIHAELDKTVWRDGGCTSWYQSDDGHVIAIFPGFSFTFWRATRGFRPADHRMGGEVRLGSQLT